MNELEKKPIEYTSEDPWSMPQALTGSQKAQRIGLAALRGAWGLPGMAADLPVTLGNALYGAFNNQPGLGQVPNNFISEKLGLPTPQSVGELFKRMGQVHATPETQEALFGQQQGTQGFAEEVAENVPGMLLGQGSSLASKGIFGAAKQIAATTAKTAAGTAASKGIGLLEPLLGKATPLAQNLGFGLTVGILDSRLNPKHLGEQVAPAFKAFSEESPKVRLKPEIAEATLGAIEQDLMHEPGFENAQEVQKVINEMRAAYAPGDMSYQEAGNLVHNIGETGHRLGGKAQAYIERAKKAVVQDMKTSNPALGKKFVDAQELFKAWQQYKDATNFVHTNDSVGKLVAKSAAAELAGKMIPGLKGAARVYTGASWANRILTEVPALKNLLKDSNIAKQYYKNIIKSGANQNAVGVYKNMVGLGNEAKKQNYGIVNGSVEKLPNKDGIIEYTSEDF